MARIRTVKPSLFSSFSTGSCPVEARYLFVGLFTMADDAGRLVDSPKQIAGHVFPHDDKITAAKVDKWLTALAQAKGNDGKPCIVRYCHESGRFIAITKWGLHQKISHPLPSGLPEPSGEQKALF
jgi:hypothetical protein